jgi:hypothetical protein
MADVGSTPQIEAPTLAAIYQKITQRPLWAVEEPLAVDADTFEKALLEMTEVQKCRGFSVAMAAIAEPNFLLRGVPVVMADG